MQRQGVRFARDTVPAIVLVPADVLRLRRPEEHFAAEAAAAVATGATVALVDHDALTEYGRAQRAVVRLGESAGGAVYRGWMLSTGQYAALALGDEAGLRDLVRGNIEARERMVV
jgi:hypothetical protein